MPDPDLLTLFVRPLEELGIRYMVSGSVASTLFGEPRMTHDVDLVAFLDEDAIAALGPVFAPPSSTYRRTRSCCSKPGERAAVTST